MEQLAWTLGRAVTVEESIGCQLKGENSDTEIPVSYKGVKLGLNKIVIKIKQ